MRGFSPHHAPLLRYSKCSIRGMLAQEAHIHQDKLSLQLIDIYIANLRPNPFEERGFDTKHPRPLSYALMNVNIDCSSLIMHLKQQEIKCISSWIKNGGSEPNPKTYTTRVTSIFASYDLLNSRGDIPFMERHTFFNRHAP